MILIDTDVLIDVALDRQPFADSASELLDRLQTGPKRAFVAWHTLSNFYYLVTPSHGGSGARDFIAELIRFVAVAECGTDAIAYAVRLDMADFEDAMQVAAARACGAGFVVTRNAKDFRRSPIPAITPSEALEALF
ncbi:MAG: PIN domain-containing protein [Gemmatimonadota bacterium]|nr:PIN domain-containing protein [Gemmatimonadota bacterium]